MRTNERGRQLDPLAATNGNGNGHVQPGHLIVHLGGGTVVVEIIGEHDLATRDTIEGLFLSLAEDNRLLVVDLSAATFIDSSFLRALVAAHKYADGKGHRLRVQVGPAELIRRVLEISNLIEYLDCVHDREEALR